jgi:hypothetical protein
MTANKFRGKWAGLACTRITDMAHTATEDFVYIMPSGENVCLIVRNDFLCALYEPKE